MWDIGLLWPWSLRVHARHGRCVGRLQEVAGSFSMPVHRGMGRSRLRHPDEHLAPNCSHRCGINIWSRLAGLITVVGCCSCPAATIFSVPMRNSCFEAGRPKFQIAQQTALAFSFRITHPHNCGCCHTFTQVWVAVYARPIPSLSEPVVDV